MQDMGSIPVIVSGRHGRMANMIADAVSETDDLRLAARISPTPTNDKQPDEAFVSALGDIVDKSPVVIDFTAPERTEWLVDAAQDTPCSLIIGTSAIGVDLEKRIVLLSESRAILRASNMSIGMLVMRETARRLATVGGAGWDASVLDIHFNGKVDPISATALVLANDWNDAAEPGAAPASLAAFRQGNGVSEHRLVCHGNGEVLEITHRIDHRSAFMTPICNAARFVYGRPAGLYSLEQIL